MQMAAARWDLAAAQIGMIMQPPGENPFRVKARGKPVLMKAGDIARIIFAKPGKPIAPKPAI